MLSATWHQVLGPTPELETKAGVVTAGVGGWVNCPLPVCVSVSLSAGVFVPGGTLPVLRCRDQFAGGCTEVGGAGGWGGGGRDLEKFGPIWTDLDRFEWLCHHLTLSSADDRFDETSFGAHTA